MKRNPSNASHAAGESARIALQIEKNRAHGRALLEGISEYALDCLNWRLGLVDAADLVRRKELDKFDAFIVRVMDRATARALAKTGKPVVDVYGRVEKSPLTTVRLDDDALGQMAAEYFAGRHFTQCAYCGFPGVRFSNARGAAFARACAERGVVCHVYANSSRGERISDTFFRDERVDGMPDAAALRAWAEGLPKPVGVFCCNDIRAAHLLAALEKSETVVGRDLAVLGTDNDAILCMTANPTLSSIDTDAQSLGRKAARLLHEAMRGAPPGVRLLHRPARIVERQSTNVWPFRHPWLGAALSFIQQHLADGVSANDVVRHVGYSHPFVNRAFVKETGGTIKQEITHQRMERAVRLLAGTDKTTFEISAICGYTTVQYFTSSFTKKFGRPPDAWRRRYTANAGGGTVRQAECIFTKRSNV